MDKFAQSKRQTGRGILNELREKINMPGAYLEGFFKPELDRVMTSLKILDDKIRSILTGQKIGGADILSDGKSAKDLLKTARTNFNRREYIAGVADLGQFHKKMFDISTDINKFFVDVNKIHHKFLFEGLDDKYKDQLEDFRKHMDTVQKKADAESRYLVKEAGIMDFFVNIGTKRGRGLAAWEKKYPKQTKDLREGGARLLEESQKLLDNTIVNLKQMASARATRRPDEYMDIANKIKADFDKYDNGDKGFRAYYNGAILPWLKIKDEIDSRDEKKQSLLPTGDPNIGKIEMGYDAPSQGPSTSGATPSGELPMGGGFATVDTTGNVGISQTPARLPSSLSPQPVGNIPPLGSGPIGGPNYAFQGPGPSPFSTAPTVPAVEETAPDTERNKTMVGLGAHKRFYQSLEALSKEDPLILAKYISKYASSIQGTDPETAIELFTIVRKIKG